MSSADERPIRALIVDDEPLARDFARRAAESVPGVAVVDECADGAAAIEAIARLRPDLVLLDVQMPEIGGFDVIEQVGADSMPEVVFVTAHDQYVLRAFEVHALDYVLKPFDPERLAAAIEHAQARIEAGRDSALRDRLATLLEELAEQRGRFASRITIHDGDRIRFVPVEDVAWIEAAGNYVRLHTDEGSHLLRHSLKGLLRRLDPAVFVRIHRSAIVNIGRIAEVQSWFGGDYLAVLRSGERLRVSRTHRDELLQMLR